MNQLKYNNNWKKDEYWVDDKRVLDLTTVSINDVFYPVTSRMVSIAYNDMGHTYTSTSKHFFVVSKDLGVEVDLNTVIKKQQVLAVDYVIS